MLDDEVARKVDVIVMCQLIVDELLEVEIDERQRYAELELEVDGLTVLIVEVIDYL